MYEGGLTEYSLVATDTYYPALHGTITNTATGTTIKIYGDRAAKMGCLTEPGEYVATFYNNPTFDTDAPAGDAWVITYRFVVIAQGTAPGPQVNKQSLSDYCTTNVSDYSPKYYGVTYSSAGKGYITLAFANYQDAFDFAYNYEKGCVEKQSDGTFRYRGTLMVKVKVQYNSLWDLTDATNYFAEQAVEELYFDLSDEFTYVTLEKSVFESCENLRTLELSKSVVVFQSEEQRLAAVGETEIPIISAKKYQYLTPGLEGTVSSDVHEFEFIKDENGYDSAKVVIVDVNGKEIEIEYNKGVAQQLKAAGCATGIVVIKETTIYGDSTEYNAIYIDDDVNTTNATISYNKDDNYHTVNVSQNTPFEKIEVSSFSIAAVSDELDPLGIVKVIVNDKETKYYTFEEALLCKWVDVGEYKVVFVNRLGYSFQIELSITEKRFLMVSFSGDGCENLEPVVVEKGKDNVILPPLDKYGYELLGYEDADGNQYKNTIDKSLIVSDMVLTPVWDAKTFTLTIMDAERNILQSMEVDFGEEYKLIPPVVDENSQFAGWYLNDEKYESDTILVETEGDIILVADIVVIETEPSETAPETETETETEEYEEEEEEEEEEENQDGDEEGATVPNGAEQSSGCEISIGTTMVLIAFVLVLAVLTLTKRKETI